MILIIFMLLLDFYIQDGLLLPGVEVKKSRDNILFKYFVW